MSSINKQFLAFFIVGTLLISCSKNEEIDPITGGKKQYEGNLDKRLEQNQNKTVLFGGSSRNRDVFASANILWKASIESLKNIPLSSIDYNAGIIITDWYGTSDRESIKITVNILSQEISPNSLEISSFKKTCQNENCLTVATNKSFNDELKSKILDKVRELSIAEAKKK
jgi:hypothetical protein